jgi:O-antigen ligase
MQAILKQSILINLLIIWFPISFLLIRHGVHLSLYAFFLLFIYELFKSKVVFIVDKKSVLLAISLGSIFIATALQQLISLEKNWSAFDGPSRLLIAGLALLYLQQKNVDYIKIIERVIPLSLIILCIYLATHTQYHWGDRWANSFVDPNSMGSQVTILSMLCLLTIQINQNIFINILKILGFIAGLYISIKTMSRGGWAVIPFMLVCWLFIEIFLIRKSGRKTQMYLISSIPFLLVVVAIVLFFTNEIFNSRINQTIYEVKTWLMDPLIRTSAGARMSMWVASFELITENWFGYGEIAIKEIAANHQLHSGLHQHGVIDLISAGPHSDILSKGLSLGLPGIVAYLVTIFTPFFLFFKNIDSPSSKTQNAARIGLIYITGLFIAGLFNEALSLKYLCSFYGLIIACLVAQVLRDNSSKRSN